jgi:AcrR family transcriptional regulator
VPRSGAEARRRLQEAALELYGERGFDQTSAADIAARAGVNERTFFRHFPDKREVLFGGEGELREALVRDIAAAPEGLAPFAVLLRAFRGAAGLLEEHRPFSAPRLALIAATPALRERDLAKGAAMADAMAAALRARGVGELPAVLAARTGWATFHVAAQAWIDEPGSAVDEHLVRAFAALSEIASGA